MPEDNQSIVDRVGKWLATEGYPLEFCTASHFRNARFHVRQGEYVPDLTGGEPRETDVTATLSYTVPKSLLRIYQLVECKWSKDKPWVVFVGPGGMAPSALISQSIASVTGRCLLWARAGDRKLHALKLFDTPKAPAFGGRQAFTDKNDVFYNTLQGVVAKASLLAKYYDENTTKVEESLEKAVVVFPVVVVDGVLLEAALDSPTGQLRLKEVTQTRIHWRGAASWRLHATIDIVAAPSLPEFCAQRYADSMTLLRQLSIGFRQLHKCWTTKSLKPLEITEGPRGILGHPTLLREMKGTFVGSKAKPRDAEA